MDDIIKIAEHNPAKWLNDPSLKEIWDDCVSLAKNGDKESKKTFNKAMKFILTRIMPGERNGATLPIKLPLIDSISDLHEAENRITHAMSEMIITISDAKDLFQILHAKRQTLLMRDIDGRFDDMEEKMKNN